MSPSKGIVLFDLIEGNTVGDYIDRQDDLANKIESKLRLHRELLKGRNLLVPLTVISFAPGVNTLETIAEDGYPIANSHESLDSILKGLKWDNSDDKIYRSTLSAIENLSSIRNNRTTRQIKKTDSLGAKLKNLEDSIATLDHKQNKAVLETVEGVQRIRGLAGSGKTIVLALKAAYLHTQHPDWHIAVTFHTRSLKGQFVRLINTFCIEQSREEPDWSKIRIINAWGAPGESSRDGMYHQYCTLTGAEYLDFRRAAEKFGSHLAFDNACKNALSHDSTSAEIYDVILVDEAQDLSPSFLKLCYNMLKQPKRLVYAYDELQNLSGESLPPPEEIFGNDVNGKPLVTFGNDRRKDIILEKCYRNSRPILVSAHSLGFGIYKEPPCGSDSGLVQMFDFPALWEEIGYKVKDGTLEKGKRVVLERTGNTSPKFLEEHSTIDELIQFVKFDDEEQQTTWLVEQISRNLNEDELRHDDIVVIHLDPLTTRQKIGPIRKMLFNKQIQTHLAGVDTDADVFFRTDVPSVTFTGIYRAKGNEAGMVYVIYAQDSNQSGSSLATLRNRLFTAITRSKAWVRVIGYGAHMDELINEFEALKNKDFLLDFTYPDDELLSRLRIVQRDLSPSERQRLEQKKTIVYQFTESLENGDLRAEDIGEPLRKLLKELLEDKD